MAKDPAFLFYSSDFLTGTYTMTDAQVGKYVRLLCLQHQKGRLTNKDMLSVCREHDEEIYSKFTKKDDKYFNERLEEESNKRKNYTQSRRDNLANSPTHKQKHMQEHMENEDVNININDNINNIKERDVPHDLMIKTYGVAPTHPRRDLIEKWLERWGDKKVRQILTEAYHSNFNNFKKLDDALDENGNIKPKENNGTFKRQAGASPEELAEILTRNATRDR